MRIGRIFSKSLKKLAEKTGVSLRTGKGKKEKAIKDQRHGGEVPRQLIIWQITRKNPQQIKEIKEWLTKKQVRNPEAGKNTTAIIKNFQKACHRITKELKENPKNASIISELRADDVNSVSVISSINPKNPIYKDIPNIQTNIKTAQMMKSAIEKAVNRHKITKRMVETILNQMQFSTEKLNPLEEHDIMRQAAMAIDQGYIGHSSQGKQRGKLTKKQKEILVAIRWVMK